MPSPAYVLFAEIVSADAQSQSINCFNIIDNVAVTRIALPPTATPADLANLVAPPPGAIKRIGGMQAVAAWIKEDGDEDREFEAQLVCTFSDGREIFRATTANFRFLGPLQRLISTARLPRPFQELVFIH